MTAQLNIHDQLKNVKVSVIKPSRARERSRRAGHGSDPEILYPTALDLDFTDIYVPTLYAYRLADASSEECERFLSRLKTSLENIQALFFPFAGRWLPHVERGRQLVCNDEGIPFLECAVDLDVDSVFGTSSGNLRAVQGLNGHEVLGMDPHHLKQAMRPEGLPSIFVQVTRFRCGGVVLGSTFNRMTADGSSFFDFMFSWAELARANQVTIKPNFDRSLSETPQGALSSIKIENSNSNGKPTTDRVSNPEELEEVEVRDHDQDVYQKQSSKREAPVGHTSESVWITKIYEVNRGVVQAMKLAVPSHEREKGRFISTGDCIQSHAWKSILRLPDSVLDKSNVSVQSLVEGRLRSFDTPLPNLCGNVFNVMVSPKVPSEELLKEPAHVTAQRLRAKLTGMKREDWRSAERSKESKEASSGSRMGFSSFYKFPLYDVDFGVGGRPYYAPGTSYLNSVADIFSCVGFCVIAPPVPSHPSSIATTIWLCQPHILDALESSPDFRALFLDSSFTYSKL